MNVTDRDSRSVRTRQGFIQGYNAQAAATREQIIVTAEIVGNGVDYGLLEPVTNAAVRELATAGVDGQIDVLLADAGYWASEQIENLAARGIQPLVPPDGQNSKRSIGKNRKGLATTSCGASSPVSTDARPLQPAKAHDRADLRPDQTQPTHQPLPTTRHQRVQIGVAAHSHHPQHPQALASE